MSFWAQVARRAGEALPLAKEIGKGGGGSTDEPTVCFSLVPIGVGILLVALGGLRRRPDPGAQPAR